MEHLLPLAIRGMLPSNALEPLIELNNFFSQLYSMVLNVGDLEVLEKQIVVTMCKLEMIFPPSFFDSMEHLPIHLAYKAKIAGPVQYRWNYFVERYLHDVETRFNRPGRNDDNTNMTVQPKLSIFQQTVHCLGKAKIRRMSLDEYNQARLYILQNCDAVLPYLEEHRQLVASERMHKKEFIQWFDKSYAQGKH